MKISYKKLPKSQAKVTVEVPLVKAQHILDRTIEKLGRDIEIKGFRKGRAPKLMLIDRLGLGRVQQEALQSIAQEAYLSSVRRYRYSPLAPPALVVKRFNVSPDGLIKEEPKIELTVDLMPEIKLGDYRKIRVNDPKLLKAEHKVSENEVDKVIEHLRQLSSTMIAVAREVKSGDWVELSFKGRRGKIEDERLASSHHPLVIGSGVMVPGFERQIIGMKKGEKKSFELTFPSKYHVADLAGKKVKFEIELHDVKKIELPALDVKFAAKFGRKSVKELKDAVKSQLVAEKKQRNKKMLENAAIQKAKKLLKVDIPLGLINREAQRLLKKTQESVEKQGVDFQRYLDSLKKTSDQLLKDLFPQAKSNIEVGFLIGEIVKREKLDPKDKQAPQKAIDRLVAYALKR